MRDLRSPRWALAAALSCAVALFAMPSPWIELPQGWLADSLRPAQAFALPFVERAQELSGRINAWTEQGKEAARLGAQIEELTRENERLTAALIAARANHRAWARSAESNAGIETSQPLLEQHVVQARVLGLEARSFLAQRHMLDAGTQSGVHPAALVLDEAPRLDQGMDAQLTSGSLVLTGRRIWGRIATVGAWTSSLQRSFEAGYRDMVWIGTSKSESTREPPRGMLEGSGEALCRIRLVDVTEPVAVGDLVYRAGDPSLEANALLYGEIVRADRPPGAAHWELWMRPACAEIEPRRVTILATAVNPERVAERTTR